MKKIYLLIITLILLSSCKDNSIVTPDNTPPPASGGIVFENNTKYFDASAMNNISSVTTNKIVFSSNPGLSSGSIIITGKSSKAPKGLLRRVTSISADGLTVTTVLASMDEAIKSGNITFNASLGKESTSPKLLIPGTIEKIEDTDLLSYSLNAVLYDLDGNLNTTNDQLRLNGVIGISSSLGGELEFSPLSAALSLNITCEVNFELLAKASFNLNNTFNVFEIEFNPIVTPTTPPIVITPVFQVYVKVEVNNNGELSARVIDLASFTSSIGYNGSWNIEKNFTNNFTSDGVNAQLNSDIKGTLGAKLSFIFYEILGPSVALEPYLELNVNTSQTPWWNLYAGAGGLVGIKTGWFGFGIPEKNWTLFNTKKLIASAQTQSNLPPSAIFSVSPSSGTTITVFEFSALSSIDDHTPQSQLKVRWDWENDGIWDTQYSTNKIETHQFSNVNYYTVAMAVMDEEGLTDETTRMVNVTSSGGNQPPAIPSNPYPANGQTVSATELILSWSCSDPEGDPLIYDIYEGSSSSQLNLIVPNLSETSYNFHNLFVPGTYYWKIVAKDNHNNSTDGPVWHFTTIDGGGTTGTFTDQRDGKIYNTVKIGNQWWFAENLDYASPNSVYYNNDQNTYGEYGRLYDWEEANQYCPSGWHLPSYDEWIELVSYVGGSDVAGGKLKETGTVHWAPPNTGATDAFGFSAFGGGVFSSGLFQSIRATGAFWSSTESGTYGASMFILAWDREELIHNTLLKIEKFSVRPIED